MDAKIDLILAAQDVQEADLKEMKKDIKQLKVGVGILPKIQEQMKQFKTDIRAVKDDINTNKASILTLEARIDEITETNESLQKDLNQQRKPTTDEPSLQDKIEEHIRRLGKKMQIIIEGIAENQLTPLETLVAQIVHDTGVKITQQDIDQVFRVGTQMKHKPRAVLVTFTKQSTRDKIYRARLDIKTNPACKNIWINEALMNLQKKRAWKAKMLAIYLSSKVSNIPLLPLIIYPQTSPSKRLLPEKPMIAFISSRSTAGPPVLPLQTSHI